ncbi:MAG: ABC transporter substrate-binding protein [Candidatus Gracilibacteria bacterium]|jgi:peptide/nickel transport system substrate-binding protein
MEESSLNQNQTSEVLHSSKKRLVKMVLGFFVIMIFAGVLFFLRAPLTSIFAGVDDGDKGQELVIAYAESFTTLSPLNYEVRNRNYLGNFYEGLTRFDKNLAIEPALAVSWGQIDDETWEFSLRSDVYFHDGSLLDSGDVVSSIEKAMQDENSQLKSLLSSVQSVSAVDDKTVTIVTNGVDPILPNRLVHVYIYSSEVTDFENVVIGTGPYYVASSETFNEGMISQELSLKAFPYYWGLKPVYSDVKLVAIPNSSDREEAISSGSVSVLVNVPIDSVSSLEEVGIKIQTQPNLDVNFLLFNTLDGNVFNNIALREAFFMALNRDELVSTLSGYANLTDQFIGQGVNGYDSTISALSYNSDQAKNIFEEYGIEELSVYMVSDMTALGDFIKDQFAAIGIDAEIVYSDLQTFQQGILDNEYDVYFMGWKCDLGDASDLYETVFHSKTDLYGAYNGGYSNSEVDSLIEDASIEEDAMNRLSILKEIAHILVEDDVAGVPMFESEVIYGFKDGVSWSPRVDGYLWASDVR